MQDYPRTSLPAQPYDNRIYQRKYDAQPRLVDPYNSPPQSTYFDYSQQRQAGFTSQQQRPYFQQPVMSQRVATFGQPQSFVSSFKAQSSTREDDLLRKLDMYEQKYQMGSKGMGGGGSGAAGRRQPFQAIQMVGQGQPTMMAQKEGMRGREYSHYSYNQSPVRENRENREIRDKPIVEQEPSGYASNSRYPPAAQRYAMDSDVRGGEARQNFGIRSSYEDLNRSFEGGSRGGYESREQPRERIQYDIGQPRNSNYQPQSRYNNVDQPRETRDIRPSFDQKPPSDARYDPRASSQRPIFQAVAPTPKSRGVSQKSSFQPPRPQPREFRQRGYDYRQGTHSRQPTETRQQVAPRSRLPPEESRNGEESRQPLGQLRDSRENNQQEETERNQMKNRQREGDLESREDRLRDVRRKVSREQNTSNTSFHLERSEKKQSLKQRSEQLRQRLNEPSPLKQRLSSANQTKQGKQNSQYQGNRYKRPAPTQKSSFPQQPSSVSFIQNQPPESQQDLKARRLSFNTEQTDRQLTPSKAKPEIQQDTYRKIETINDLNNKINERIRHILSTFNQEPTC